MTVISEEKLCRYLQRVLDLSRDTLRVLDSEGTEAASNDRLDQFHQIVNDLNRERESDDRLTDDSWNWLWEGKASMNHIQLYGRLAYLNHQLLDLF